MKKLMFATALAASVAAFGAGDGNAMVAPLSATGFEGYGLGAGITTNLADKSEAGIDLMSGEDYITYFWFSGGDSNSSVVTNEDLSFGTKRTAYFDSLDPKPNNEQYLALDTEGGTLWRSINPVGLPSTELGAAQTVVSSTYLDTLVQFTVTEDEAPTTTPGDKLAIWLQASTSGETTVTNLMVRAGFVDDNGSATSTVSNDYVIASATVTPGTWYRLTVKAIADVTKCKEKNGEYNPNGITGFEIYLDGTQLIATTAAFAQGYIDRAIDASEYGWLDQTADAEFITYLTSGKVFPSLQGETTGEQLQAVGFQGTGAVDEIVWTEQDLFPAGGATTIEFTLTGAENATVSYVIGSDASQNWDGSSTISVEPSTTVTFTATPASGYTYEGVTAEGWTLNNGDLVCETNSTESITLAVPNAVALVTLTDPGIANATLTSPVLPAQYAPGATVELTWTAAPGYTFPNGQTTVTRTVTVGVDDLAAIASEVESSLSKQTFTVTVTDIENATIAATTNSIELTNESENAITNKYTVEYGATVTVTATAAAGFEFVDTPEGWTLTEGVLSIETNVTAAVELAAPVPTAKTATVTITIEGNDWQLASYGATDGNNQEVSFSGNSATVNVGTTITIEATPNTGYEYATVPTGWTAGQNGAITKTITVDDNVSLEIPAPTATTIAIEPGAQGGTTYATEADAAAVTNNVTVAVPAAVSGAGVDATAYKANFEPKVVSDGNGGYKIEIGLTAAAEADLQTQANTDAGTLVSDITASAVTITTTPGFYYSVKYGSSLNAMNAQTAGVLADGTTKSITLPVKSGTSGFYKVVISIVPNEAVTP